MVLSTIRKCDKFLTAEVQGETNAEVQVGTNAEVEGGTNAEVQSETNARAQGETNTEVQGETNAEVQEEMSAEVQVSQTTFDLEKKASRFVIICKNGSATWMWIRIAKPGRNPDPGGILNADPCGSGSKTQESGEGQTTGTMST